MKLQIQKDIEALPRKPANKIRTGNGKEFLANLEAALRRFQTIDQLQRRPGVGVVQCDDDPGSDVVFHGHVPVCACLEWMWRNSSFTAKADVKQKTVTAENAKSPPQRRKARNVKNNYQ